MISENMYWTDHQLFFYFSDYSTLQTKIQGIANGGSIDLQFFSKDNNCESICKSNKVQQGCKCNVSSKCKNRNNCLCTLEMSCNRATSDENFENSAATFDGNFGNSAAMAEHSEHSENHSEHSEKHFEHSEKHSEHSEKHSEHSENGATLGGNSENSVILEGRNTGNNAATFDSKHSEKHSEHSENGATLGGNSGNNFIVEGRNTAATFEGGSGDSTTISAEYLGLVKTSNITY